MIVFIGSIARISIGGGGGRVLDWVASCISQCRQQDDEQYEDETKSEPNKDDEREKGAVSEAAEEW